MGGRLIHEFDLHTSKYGILTMFYVYYNRFFLKIFGADAILAHTKAWDLVL